MPEAAGGGAARTDAGEGGADAAALGPHPLLGDIISERIESARS